jgi:hypothetical protein
MRRKLVAMVFVVLAAVVAAATGAGAAERPIKACPQGFNLGAHTFEAALLLPKLQAALADGVATLEGVQAVHEFADKNGNGVLCFQDVPQRGGAAPQSGSEYALVLIDDNAAVGQ